MPAALLLSVITNSNKASRHIQYLRKKINKKKNDKTERKQMPSVLSMNTLRSVSRKQLQACV